MNPSSQSKKLFPPKTDEATQTRRFPKFFSSVGKSENNSTVEADQASARIARATRNSGATSANSHAAKESKPTQSQSSTEQGSSKTST